MATNGVHPQTELLAVSEGDPLAPYIEGLERELAPLAAKRAQLESEVAEILKQEQRITAGIQALKSGAPKKKAATPAKAPTGGGNDWRPSQKTLDDVYAALSRSDAPMTVREIADASGVSRGTVQKSLDVLRSEERVRLAGNAAAQGAPKVYGVMP